MIQGVQRLGAELHIDAFGNRDCAEYAHVQIEEPGTSDNVPASGAEPLRLAGGNINHRKGAAIEILIGRRIAAGEGSTAFQVVIEDLHIRLDQVRHLTAAGSVQIPAYALDDSDRRAARGAHYAAHLESSHEFADESFARELLSTAERQFP